MDYDIFDTPYKKYPKFNDRQWINLEFLTNLVYIFNLYVYRVSQTFIKT